MRRFCFALLALLPLSLAAGGEVESPAVAALPSYTPPVSLGMGSVIQVAVMLLLVIGLILLMAWLVRRVGGFNLHGGQVIRIVAGLSISHRERLLLVDVAGQQLLLGVSPGRIETLHRFESPVVTLGEDTVALPFAERLAQFIQQRTAGGGG
jgi:flagellar protein FliO/FliZ